MNEVTNQMTLSLMGSILKIAEGSHDVIVVGSEECRPLDAIELLTNDRPDIVNTAISGNSLLIWY